MPRVACDNDILTLQVCASTGLSGVCRRSFNHSSLEIHVLHKDVGLKM